MCSYLIRAQSRTTVRGSPGDESDRRLSLRALLLDLIDVYVVVRAVSRVGWVYVILSSQARLPATRGPHRSVCRDICHLPRFRPSQFNKDHPA